MRRAIARARLHTRLNCPRRAKSRTSGKSENFQHFVNILMAKIFTKKCFCDRIWNGPFIYLSMSLQFCCWIALWVLYKGGRILLWRLADWRISLQNFARIPNEFIFSEWIQHNCMIWSVDLSMMIITNRCILRKKSSFIDHASLPFFAELRSTKIGQQTFLRTLCSPSLEKVHNEFA